MGVSVDSLASRYPSLYHMAETGSWRSITTHGLLSTTALLDLFEVTDPLRHALESCRRPDSVTISHPRYGQATIRDNRPINETVLKRTLVGMELAEWYRTLNRRVFFWFTVDRLDRLRRAYRDRPHDILTVDTQALLDYHHETVELAHLNTGAVFAAANYPRGAGTFQPLDSYPWDERCSVSGEPAVELTVPYAVPDISRFVIGVTTR